VHGILGGVYRDSFKEAKGSFVCVKELCCTWKLEITICGLMGKLNKFFCSLET
jgi:hypothetical protein